MKVVDVSYGGDNGFNQAITLAADALADVKFVAEKKLISRFLQEISLDTGMICFGVDDTMKALEAGALETIMIYEEIEYNRYEIKQTDGSTRTYFLKPNSEKDRKYFKDATTGIELDVVADESLAEWICHHYQSFGASLEFITDKSQEGY